MPQKKVLLHFSPSARSAPDAVVAFAGRGRYELVETGSVDEVLSRVSRSYPRAVIIDASSPSAIAVSLCSRIKDDSFTSVVPVVMYVEAGGQETVAAALEAGADEVIVPAVAERESALRLDLALRRAERDVSVHPTTRLPGTVQIERDFGERLNSGEKFAVCYADLDHFKEFNDRYGYHHGDRVILIVSMILREVVRSHSPAGFVGHIGGDDFIFNVPLEHLARCCEDVIEVFDDLVPLQYSAADRARGTYLGKDRRGHEYEVPLMTLSIGVVTNEYRVLTHTAEISELATEMKSYAKSFPGSLYVADRRGAPSDNPEDPA